MFGAGRSRPDPNLQILPLQISRDVVFCEPPALGANKGACSVGRYAVPVKTRVLVNTFAIGKDPNVWEEPLEFQPKRFVAAGDGGDMKGPPRQDFRLLLFGGGRRGCPGYTLRQKILRLRLMLCDRGLLLFYPFCDEYPLRAAGAAGRKNPQKNALAFCWLMQEDFVNYIIFLISLILDLSLIYPARRRHEEEEGLGWGKTTTNIDECKDRRVSFLE